MDEGGNSIKILSKENNCDTGILLDDARDTRGGDEFRNHHVTFTRNSIKKQPGPELHNVLRHAELLL